MIVEEQINSLDTINLKFKKNKYPQCSDQNYILFHFFVVREVVEKLIHCANY